MSVWLRHNQRFLTGLFKNIFSPLIMNKNPKSTQIIGSALAKSPVQLSVLPTPIKSDTDKKEYKVIRLENGLTACLVSDVEHLCQNPDEDEPEEECGTSDESGMEEEEEEEEEDDEGSDVGSTVSTSSKKGIRHSKMAAAALCVGVGSFSDPKHIPGMAHFLEHMVFMGSEKYPEENDFDSFISKKGGSDNASTDFEVTNFYFECLDKDLYEALDKFAQFFISPLMKRESMTREREAIDSEFQMALPSDTYRREQLLCSLAKKDSPVNKFAWGNLETLRENISDDELYESLHEFRKRHYSANRMTLAIQARFPIENLESFVLELFSQIPNNNLGPLNYKQEHVFDTPEFCKMYYIKPTKNVSQLELTWALPSLLHKYKSKPHQYVSWLLGDEGKGSLLSYLRKKVWVLSMTAGNGESGSEHNSLFALFTICMNLTDEGLENMYSIIEIVFSYINMLKKLGPVERIYNEIKTIEDTSFRFAPEEDAVEFVEELAENMHIYPPKDYIAGSELYFEYDPEGINDVLENLSPRKMNIFVLTNKLPNGMAFTKKEKWFRTPFVDLDIKEEYLKKWETVEPLSEFSIPPPNQYLTKDFTLLPELPNHPDYPLKIFTNKIVELWYRQDQKFKLPLAFYQFILINPILLDSTLNVVMLDMFVNLLQMQLVEEAYPAQVAELNYVITTNDKGVVIKVNGFNEKLPILIELITKYLTLFSTSITEEVFNAVKEKLSKHYHNGLLKPSSIAKDLRLKLLVHNYFTTLEKFEAISEVTLDKVKAFSADYLKNLYIKGLVQGNVSKEQAISVVKKFVNTLKCEEIPQGTYPKFNVYQVPKGTHYCQVENFNKTDTNTIVSNYFQVGTFKIEDSVLIETIMLIIQEPLFDTLRTKEQLGYSVSCSHRETYGILGFTLKVNSQATKFTPKHVDERIHEFVKSFTTTLDEMTELEFDDIKKDLIKKKQCSDVHLREEVVRNWTEIIDDEYKFDRLKSEIEAIKKLNLDDVRNFWKIHTGLEKTKKLSVRVVGFDIKGGQNILIESEEMRLKFLKENNDTHHIDDIRKFQTELEFYPYLKKLEQ